MSLKVCFLLPDLQLAGGIGVVVNHARGLATEHGMEVAIALTGGREREHWSYDGVEHLEILTLEEASARRYDVAVATWWETAYHLLEIPAERYAYFVQSLEERFYGEGREERVLAAATLGLPVAFITEARWIRDTLAAVRPDADCYLVRNGVDKRSFPLPAELEVRTHGPLRVMVEGAPSAWFKGIEDAVSAIGAMEEPAEVTFVTPVAGAFGWRRPPGEVVGPLTAGEMAALYARKDVVLKTSRVEGMYGPPLEGFHRGATCVTTPVTGHEEFVRHLWNGVVVDWDDPGGTARWLDLLAKDRRLLHFLRMNAVETARGWPSWRQSTDFMAAALGSIRRRPAAVPSAGSHYLASVLRSDLGDFRRVHARWQEAPVRTILARVAIDRVKRRMPPGLRTRLVPVVRRWLRRPGGS